MNKLTSLTLTVLLLVVPMLLVMVMTLTTMMPRMSAAVRCDTRW